MDSIVGGRTFPVGAGESFTSPWWECGSCCERFTGLMAMSWGGGAECGRGGGGRGLLRYRGVPSREEIPGVEDLEVWWEDGGDTAAGGNMN